VAIVNAAAAEAQAEPKVDDAVVAEDLTDSVGLADRIMEDHITAGMEDMEGQEHGDLGSAC